MRRTWKASWPSCPSSVSERDLFIGFCFAYCVIGRCVFTGGMAEVDGNKFIVLEDLCRRYKNPCVLDCKVWGLLWELCGVRRACCCPWGPPLTSRSILPQIEYNEIA